MATAAVAAAGAYLWSKRHEIKDQFRDSRPAMKWGQESGKSSQFEHAETQFSSEAAPMKTGFEQESGFDKSAKDEIKAGATAYGGA